MLEQLIPLASGALGGLAGGAAVGGMFKNAGVGRGSSSTVGILAGAIATYFFGPTLGPMIGSVVGSGMLESVLGGLVSGAGGGGIGVILFGLIRKMMGG